MNSMSWRIRVLLLGAALTLCGCANLDSVREFGKTAASITSYPDADAAFEQGAIPLKWYKVRAPGYVDLPVDHPDIRHAQVQRALAAQASLTAYFTTLAKLAGDDAFTLDKQIDAVDKDLKALPGSAKDATDIDAAIVLVKIAAKYALAEKQAEAVKALVRDGGPHAMRVLDSLVRTTSDWEFAVRNDKASVTEVFDTLPRAKNTSTLEAIMASERGDQLAASYDQSIKKLQTTKAALLDIKRAHAEMADSVAKLSFKEWTAVLKGAVGDLQTAKKNIELLR